MIELIKGVQSIRINWYRLTALIVFLLTISILTRHIIQLDRGLNLNDLRAISLIAGLLGLLLTFVKGKNPVLKVISAIIGAFIVVFGIFGNLFQSFLNYLQTLFTYLSLYWKYIYFETIIAQPETDPIKTDWAFFKQAALVLFDRLRDWVASLPNPAYDPVSLNLVWGLILWFVSLWLFWYIVQKKEVLLGFLPGILIIAGVYRTTEERLFNLWFVLGFALFLVVLANFSKSEDYWLLNRISVTATIRSKTARYSIFLSVLLVTISATLSSQFLDDLIEDWREQRLQTSVSGQVDDSANRVSLPEDDGLIGPEKVLEELSDGLLPNVHLIGSSPDLAEIEVMHVRIEEIDRLAPRYYLRSATYEGYSLDGWLANHKGFIVIPAEETFEIDFSSNERLIFQEVIHLENQSQGYLMYLVGDLTAANVATTASYHTKFVNNTYADLFAVVTDSPQYAAYSKVPSFGENELRNTSNIYPDWIENKYLQLPDSISDRVYELAIDLTATQPTPYDRAVAIEAYLRQFEYSLDIEDPPYYEDIVDYFLFDLQKGYCDYFASSMVVLSRAAGLPARLATGYLASTYDPESDHFIVTADQAHSWVEIYFPEYGWVSFEPTSGRPAISRPEEREEISEEMITDFELELIDPSSDQTTLKFLPRNLFILVGQIFILWAIGLFIFHWLERWWLKQMKPNRLFALIYQKLLRKAKVLGVKTGETNTPREFSSLFTNHLSLLNANPIYSIFSERTQLNLDMIITACNHAAYVEQSQDKSTIDQVISAWGKVRWQLALARFLIRSQPFTAELRRIWTRLQQPA